MNTFRAALSASVLALPAIVLAGNDGSSSPDTASTGRTIVTRGQAPETYGTASKTFLTLGAWDARPYDSTFTYAATTAVNGGSGITRTNAAGASWVKVPVHLPAGASLTEVEFNYCDTGASTFGAFFFTVEKNNGLENFSLLGSTGTPGCVVETATLVTPITIDNNLNSYHIEINMGTATDGSIVLGSLRVGYYLQVSPAPAPATFGDVPTNHPFYQFIEALAASGITGGCGSGNYCPDNPVTRGQMAVFLSKALGLHFPN